MEEVKMITVRAPFNDMVMDELLYRIWIGQFCLVWIVLFCMAGYRIYSAIKGILARGKQNEDS